MSTTKTTTEIALDNLRAAQLRLVEAAEAAYFAEDNYDAATAEKALAAFKRAEAAEDAALAVYLDAAGIEVSE